MAKKAAAKKSAGKAVKKAAAKKAPLKKAKKVAPRKAPVKKSVPAKGDAGKKVVRTTVTARVDVGFGNDLFIRGEGAGLSWDKGVLMDNVSPYEWVWKTTRAKSDVEFKFLINDEQWADGDNLTVSPGGASISTPTFS